MSHTRRPWLRGTFLPTFRQPSSKVATMKEPKPHDEDIDKADGLIERRTHALAGPNAAIAQALALISIAKTLRRLELRLPK